MVEIVKKGVKKEITCKNCGSVLSYFDCDIEEKIEKIGYYNDERAKILFLKCPVCGNEIEMEHEEAKKMSRSGFSSHDCESHYDCPNCGKDYGSWDFVNGKVKIKDDCFICECGSLLRVPK